MVRQPGQIFVGRQREIAVLRTALDDAMSGHGRLVMLAGEPGIGKTRTAQELASYAQQKGAQVLWGWCYEREGAPPYWPWVQPIQSYVLDTVSEQLFSQLGPGAADIAELIPEIREKLPDLEPPPALQPEETRFRLFNSISSFLKNLAESKSLVLVLDDLHWADTPSLLLLEFLAQQMAESRILVIGAYRDIEISRQHPLSESLAQLSRSPAFQRLVLGGLASEDVGPFVRAAGRENPSVELINAIYAHTEGNPLFMTEVIRLLGDQESLEASAGVGAPVALGLPQGVLEVIGQRLNRLSAECVGVLTTAAVIGRQFDFNLLGILSEETTEFRLLGLVEEALEGHIIQDLPGQRDRYQFSHALVQQTLLERLSTSRKVRLHVRIGETLETLYGDKPGDHAAELAYHYSEGLPVTGPERLVHYSLLAGQNAVVVYAFEEAQAHFERGLVSRGITLTGAQPATDEEAAALLFGLGCAQLATVERHRLSEAVACLRRAFDYYAEAGEVDRAVAVAQHPLPMATVFSAEAAQLNRRALELVERDSHDEGRLLSQYSRTVYFEENDFEAARDAYTRALAIARRENDTDLELRTLGVAAHVNAFHCNYQECLEMSLRGLELARRVDNPRAEWDLQFWTGGMRIATGDLQGAKPHLESARDLAGRRRDRYYLLSALWLSAQASNYEGDWEATRNFSDQGLELSSKDFRNLATRMQLEFELGEFHQAEAYLERLIDAVRLTPPGASFEYMVSALGIPLAARITGDARHFEIAEAAADAILTAPNAATYLRWGAKAGLGLIAVQRGDSAAAANQYAALAASHGSANAGIPLVSDRLLGLLAQTMGSPDLAAEHFEAALAFCSKGGYRPELAWTCYDYADTLLKRSNEGDGAKATALLDESLAVSSGLGMRPLVERVAALQERAETQPVRAPVYPNGLTQREVDVIRLVAQGNTNRKIADELFISLNTVLHHVSNILSKTEKTNRAGIATYAAQHDLAG